ncbi:MAG: histidine--tRNA ligase [bacterium]|nr:histidine--tRNA ligase [bacterium]
MKEKGLQAPRGMHDILPEEQKYWRYILKKAESIIEDYGFERIDTPIVESTELFLRGVGENTDIVEKEMYSFKTRGGDDLSLRPEGTAGVVRAYIENGMQVRPHPVKLYYYGPMFRHDQPQAGRYRQHWQLGIETIGDASEIVDAELIFVAYKILESLGLKNYNVQINSLGDASSRAIYVRALKDYYKPKLKKVCAQCKNRFKKNILRMLDCKEETCREAAKDIPSIFDFLSDDAKRHFKRTIEILDECRVPYILNQYLVRGLDYYTHTVFEFVPELEEGLEKGPENQPNPVTSTPGLALGGGGRYDRLIDILGGPKTPAAGWALGLDRIVLALKQNNINVPEVGIKPKVFLAQLGEAAKKKSLILFENIRKAGIEVKSSLGRDSIKSQLRIAHRLGVKYTLIFGQKEAIESTIIIREMDTGIQETVLLAKVVDEMKKRLKK